MAGGSRFGQNTRYIFGFVLVKVWPRTWSRSCTHLLEARHRSRNTSQDSLSHCTTSDDSMLLQSRPLGATQIFEAKHDRTQIWAELISQRNKRTLQKHGQWQVDWKPSHALSEQKQEEKLGKCTYLLIWFGRFCWCLLFSSFCRESSTRAVWRWSRINGVSVLCGSPGKESSSLEHSSVISGVELRGGHSLLGFLVKFQTWERFSFSRPHGRWKDRSSKNERKKKMQRLVDKARGFA